MATLPLVPIVRLPVKVVHFKVSVVIERVMSPLPPLSIQIIVPTGKATLELAGIVKVDVVPVVTGAFGISRLYSVRRT